MIGRSWHVVNCKSKPSGNPYVPRPREMPGFAALWQSEEKSADYMEDEEEKSEIEADPEVGIRRVRGRPGAVKGVKQGSKAFRTPMNKMILVRKYDSDGVATASTADREK